MSQQSSSPPRVAPLSEAPVSLSSTCLTTPPHLLLAPHTHSGLSLHNADHRDTQNHTFPSSLNRKPQSLLLLGARPGECCLHALAPPHSVGFSHLHYERLELLDAHELPIFHLRPLGTWRMARALAPHSSTLAWKMPWTEEPGRLQSMGSLRVGHD